MEELPQGSMIAVFLPEKDLQPLLNPRLSIALINAPSCAWYPEKQTMWKNSRTSFRHGHRHPKTQTEHAFHSSMTEPILDRFADELRKVTFGTPRIPLVSNVTARGRGREAQARITG
jgi:acyl transferase domain-containing protein